MELIKNGLKIKDYYTELKNEITTKMKILGKNLVLKLTLFILL